MRDANIQNDQFSNVAACKIVLKHNIAQWSVRNVAFLIKNSGAVNHTKQKLSGVLLPLVFISTGNCNDSYE